MSYQGVSGSPRFYVNVVEWLDTIGMTVEPSMYGEYVSSSPSTNYTGTNSLPMGFWHTLSASVNTTISIPSEPSDFNYKYITFPNQGVSYSQVIGENGFVAYLGHNFKSISGEFLVWSVGYPEGTTNSVDPSVTNTEGVVNWGDTLDIPVEYDGFSIVLGDYSTVTKIPNGMRLGGSIIYQMQGYTIGDNLQLNSIVLGSYYDMDAPNLSLTMSREYDTTKEMTSYVGSTFSNTMGSQPPKWGIAGAWELYTSDESTNLKHNLRRSGRRTWKLEFSYMDRGDLWGSNQALRNDMWGVQDTSIYGDDLWGSGDHNQRFKYNIYTDINFYSQVWHKTLGGTIPFIFQPDNNNPDGFAICRFRENSLKAKRSSLNTFDISVTIEEVW